MMISNCLNISKSSLDMEPLPRPGVITIILGALTFGGYNEIIRCKNDELLHAQYEHMLWRNSNVNFKFEHQVKLR